MTQSKLPPLLIFITLSLFSVSFVLSLFLLQLFGGLIFVFWIFEKWSEKKNILNIVIISIIIFAFVRLISIIFSKFPESSNQSFYKEALFYAVIVALPFYLKTLNKDKLLKLVLIFIFGAALMSLVGITKFVIGDVKRAEAFSSGYTVFSSYLLVAFGIALYFPEKVKIGKLKYYKSTLIIIIFLGIITSLGRMSMAIALLLFLSAVVFKKFNLKQIITLSIVFLMIGLLYYYYPSQEISQRVTNITQLSDRDILWKGAMKIAGEHPFIGFGPRTFNDIFPLTSQFEDKQIGAWHNDFLQIYFESGLLGLLSFIFLLVAILGTSFNQIRNKKMDADIKALSASIFGSLIALILSSLTAGFITSVVLSIVFAFQISILIRIESEKPAS
jgi:O-antigen ligase